MPGSLRLGRVFGIEIRVHFSWALIFVLVTFSLAQSVLPASWSDTKQLVVAAIAALLFFICVLLHELAHSLVARRLGMRVSSITLFLLGGVSNLTEEPKRASAEFFMAVAGPLTSFVLAGLAYGVHQLAARVIDATAMTTVTPVTDYLTTINIGVGLFNLVPGFPLDGGRVLRSIIWGLRRDRSAATRIASRGGEVIAVLLGLIGGLLLLIGDAVGLWYFVIAYFLFGMARGSFEQERVEGLAKGIRVRQLMSTDFRSTSPEATLDAFIRDLVLPFNLRAVPVLSQGRLQGVLTIGDLHKVVASGWSSTRVGQAMIPARDVHSIAPDDLLVSALERLGPSDTFLPVIEAGAVVGVLERDAVTGYLRTREMLESVRRGNRAA
jgi:Zn-dependent protease/predicted transcriptional regulator